MKTTKSSTNQEARDAWYRRNESDCSNVNEYVS